MKSIVHLQEILSLVHEIAATTNPKSKTSVEQMRQSLVEAQATLFHLIDQQKLLSEGSAVDGLTSEADLAAGSIEVIQDTIEAIASRKMAPEAAISSLETRVEELIAAANEMRKLLAQVRQQAATTASQPTSEREEPKGHKIVDANRLRPVRRD